VAFDPHKNFLATGSMDQTCKLWDLETGKEHSTLKGHEGEIVSLNFNNDGDKILTGSFDGTAIVHFFSYRQIWDTRTGEPIHLLQGHTG
jgi:dynein assembly factor with WDR repeat domains 1